MLEGQRDHFVKCQCDLNEHMVRFTYWPRRKNARGDEDPPEMWIHCQLVPHNSFWERLKLAVKYLFKRGPGKEYWGFWDETLLDEEEMLKLEQFMEHCVTDWAFETPE